MRLLAIASGLLIATVLCFAVPGDFYFGNTLEFPLRFSSYLPLLAAAAFSILVVTAAIALIAPRPVRKWVAIVLGAITIVVYVNAMVVGTDVGTLTGKTVTIPVGTRQLLGELAILVAATVIVAKAHKFASIAFLVLAAGNLAMAGYAAVTEDKQNPPIPDQEKLYSMGDKNLLVVLLDGFPSDVFGEIIKSDEKHKATLDGFTYYEDMAAIAATTYLALPSIHAGAVYQPGQPLRPYFTEAVERDSFLTRLAAANYVSLLVNPMLRICPDNTTCYLPQTLWMSPSEMRWDGVLTLFGVSVFRAAPASLKEAAYNQGKWAFASLQGDITTKDHTVEGIKILDLFAKRMKAGTGQTAKFLHVLTPHLPVVLGDGCAYAGGPIPVTREAFVQQARCSLDAFETIVASLKANGLYDKTTIVLLADHGQAIPSIKADAPGEWQKLSGWANPLFAVKPAGAKGELKVSNESLWLPDIPSIICRETGGCQPGEVAHHDTRLFNYYEWKNEYWQQDIIPVAQYPLNGVPWQVKSWGDGQVSSAGPAN